MIRRLLSLALAIAVLGALPQAALAASTLDQEQATYDGFSGNSKVCVAQTFTAGMTGRLDRVALYVRKITDHPILRVEVREAQSGAPGAILASVDVPGTQIDSTFSWIDADFDVDPIVQAGKVYAITVPPLGPMGPDPDPWGFEIGGATQTSSFDPYVGGFFMSAGSCEGPYGVLSADLAFRTFVDPTGAYVPDGRIRVFTGAWIGGNTYNATGAGQSRIGRSSLRSWVVFRIGVQNDGFVRDRFLIDAEGANVKGYKVRYFFKAREITKAVQAGTFRTRWLAPGKRQTIEAWVRIKPGAARGSEVQRLVTITSTGDGSTVDAVAFTARRR